MPKRLYRSFQALLLLGMSIFLGSKAASGQLTFYINQRFVPLTIFGIIFLAVLAQTMFSEIKRSRQHDDEHDQMTTTMRPSHPTCGSCLSPCSSAS